jgi:hypothetical protein
MQIFHSLIRIRWLLLGVALLVTCLCMVFMMAHLASLLNASPIADYLWSIRATQDLSNKGILVHNITVSDSQPPGYRLIDIQVGNLIHGKSQPASEIVEIVHKAVILTYVNLPVLAKPVNGISVTVFNYSGGLSMVGIDFETAREYQLGEVSRETYLNHWSFLVKMHENSPP